ncbi:GAF and ANTAR domain-containing protein [Streptomyces minutiscleroticus]|uniref:GAF and ANTAR domain-containing protein n=1 Tax=Streptomyces minutiscleroticus TaxID=68238 RepID=UPI003318AB91
MGQGPSLTAFRTEEPVAVPVVDHAGSAWPLFTDAACRIGVSAAFAYPLRTATATLGTLTLYRTHQGTRPTRPPALGRTCAEIATLVLLADRDTDIIEQLRATADADDINTTIGILAAARHTSTDDAAAWLHATAETTGRPLADIARDILTRYGHTPRDRP